jgi:hypothetical protein
VSQPPELPPDPMTQTKNRMVELGTEKAKEMAARKLRQTIKGYVPKFLHPLIPGEGGSVGGNLEKAAKKKAAAMFWSAVISLVFFAIFGCAFLGFGLVVVYAVWSSM